MFFFIHFYSLVVGLQEKNDCPSVRSFKQQMRLKEDNKKIAKNKITNFSQILAPTTLPLTPPPTKKTQKGGEALRGSNLQDKYRRIFYAGQHYPRNPRLPSSDCQQSGARRDPSANTATTTWRREDRPQLGLISRHAHFPGEITTQGERKKDKEENKRKARK